MEGGRRWRGGLRGRLRLATSHLGPFGRGALGPDLFELRPQLGHLGPLVGLGELPVLLFGYHARGRLLGHGLGIRSRLVQVIRFGLGHLVRETLSAGHAGRLRLRLGREPWCFVLPDFAELLFDCQRLVQGRTLQKAIGRRLGHGRPILLLLRPVA
jgi:hypothetical protein